MYVCVCVTLCVCLFVYACMYVCLCPCMLAYMHVCLYVYTAILCCYWFSLPSGSRVEGLNVGGLNDA